jgi:hypothetical protein
MSSEMVESAARSVCCSSFWCDSGPDMLVPLLIVVDGARTSAASAVRVVRKKRGRGGLSKEVVATEVWLCTVLGYILQETLIAVRHEDLLRTQRRSSATPLSNQMEQAEFPAQRAALQASPLQPSPQRHSGQGFHSNHQMYAHARAPARRRRPLQWPENRSGAVAATRSKNAGSPAASPALLHGTS